VLGSEVRSVPVHLRTRLLRDQTVQRVGTNSLGGEPHRLRSLSGTVQSSLTICLSLTVRKSQIEVLAA
jgi:hypothetical protein